MDLHFKAWIFILKHGSSFLKRGSLFNKGVYSFVRHGSLFLKRGSSFFSADIFLKRESSFYKHVSSFYKCASSFFNMNLRILSVYIHFKSMDFLKILKNS